MKKGLINKIEVIGDNSKDNLLKTIEDNRGIKDINKIIEDSKNPSVCYGIKKLKNGTKAVKLILEEIEKPNAVVKIIIDSDADGYTSGALMYNYLQRIKPDLDLRYGVHKNENCKTHGVFNDDIEDEVTLVIVPDAGTHSGEELEKIEKRGIKTLVLDHHKAKDDVLATKVSIVVNNQLCDYPNKDLSGVGIVYKICEGIDKKLKTNHATDFLDLVAVGMIADVMNTTTLETRYYMNKGIEIMKEGIEGNRFLRALMQKQSYSLNGEMNFTAISWKIAPLINAAIRFGSLEERENLFEAFIEGNKKTLPYKKRGEVEETQQHITVAMARICGNIKSRQDNAKKKVVKSLKEKIKENNLMDNKILAVEATEELEGKNSSLTGLVAMTLADDYKKPTIVYRDTGKKDETGAPVYSGSGRNFDHSPIDNLQKLLLSLDSFNLVQGHANAFGHEIKQDKIEDMINFSNEKLSDVEIDTKFLVDFLYFPTDLKTKHIETISSYKDEWGQGMKEPFLAVLGLEVNNKEVSVLGARLNTVKFKVNGIEFIKFFCSKDEVERFFEPKDNSYTIDIVGKASENSWNGKTTPQIIISEWDIVENEEKAKPIVRF